MGNGHQCLQPTASPANVSQHHSTHVNFTSQQVWIWVYARGKQSELNVRITPSPSASSINKLLSQRRPRIGTTIPTRGTSGRSLRCNPRSSRRTGSELRPEALPWHPSAVQSSWVSHTIILSLRDPRTTSLSILLSWSSRPWLWWAILISSNSRKQAWYHSHWPQLTKFQPRRSKSNLSQPWTCPQHIKKKKRRRKKYLFKFLKTRQPMLRLSLTTTTKCKKQNDPIFSDDT